MGGGGGMVFYQVSLLSKSQVQSCRNLKSKKTKGREENPLVEVSVNSMEEKP
jgi:hypothetical protein